MSKKRRLNRRQFLQLSASVITGTALATRIGSSTAAPLPRRPTPTPRPSPTATRTPTVTPKPTIAPTLTPTRAPTPTWPTLPAFSTNNFLDHFTGANLTARWTAVTSGAGTVAVADSYVNCNAPANSAAFIYHNTKLDKTKSQLWTICFNRNGGLPTNYFWIVNKATAPVADSYANIGAITRIRAGLVDDVNGQAFGVEYFDTSHTRTRWDGGTSTWSSAAANMYAPTRNDDYYILGFENDGPNARWRLMGWCQASSGGYTFEQGWRMFGLTDWVNWSGLEASTDLWLMLGNAYNGNAFDVNWRYEWVRYAENNSPIEAWCNQKGSFSAADGGIRHLYSHDGLVFVPQDRTTVALDNSTANYEDLEVTEPWAVNSGTTDYLFYNGVGTGIYGCICVAKAPHTTPQNGPWTRAANNPILAPLGATESMLGFPCVIKDVSEPDASKRWKMLYSAKDANDNKWRLYYATAADPPDTSPWTRQGRVLDVGAAGQSDSTAARDAVVVWYGGQWEVWYEGWDDNGYVHFMRATGSNLLLLTKDGAGARLSAQANGETTLTATLSGRIVTVASTQGFVADGMVAFDQDPDLDNYGVSRIRKVLSATQVELYHALEGFAPPAKMQQLDACKYFTPRFIGSVGGEWWFYLTNWEPFSSDGPNYGGLLEQMTIHKHASATPSGGTPQMQMLASPVASRGFNNDQHSLENMSLLMPPLVRG